MPEFLIARVGGLGDECCHKCARFSSLLPYVETLFMVLPHHLTIDHDIARYLSNMPLLHSLRLEIIDYTPSYIVDIE